MKNIFYYLICIYLNLLNPETMWYMNGWNEHSSEKWESALSKVGRYCHRHRLLCPEQPPEGTPPLITASQSWTSFPTMLCTHMLWFRSAHLWIVILFNLAYLSGMFMCKLLAWCFPLRVWASFPGLCALFLCLVFCILPWIGLSWWFCLDIWITLK